MGPQARRDFLRPIGDPAWSAWQAGLTCRTAGGTALPALIVTSWHVTDPAKTTTITYESGAQLTLDHTAVAGYLTAGHQLTALYGADASTPGRNGTTRPSTTTGSPKAASSPPPRSTSTCTTCSSSPPAPQSR
jgi:hypothetical protein